MIKFENVTKMYANGFMAVDNMNLHINEGEFIVLIGPSGCGKTTSMKMINGLIEPSGGEIYINGEPIKSLNPYELRRKIGYVIQDIGLMPHMTIAENIAIVPKMLKWDKKKIEERSRELLELVGLNPDETMKKYPKQLSGGQKQRVGVARALAADPPIMLMDEPFGALDPITREQLQDEFIRLQKKMKKTIVFVTHDMDEAIKFADRIVIMNKGKIVQIASPIDILQKPSDSFVVDFIGSDNAYKQLSLVEVSDVLKTDSMVVPGDTPVLELKNMLNAHQKEALVSGEDGTIEGYVRASHLAGKEDTKQAKDLCSHFKVSVNIEEPSKKALASMIEKGTAHAAVLDRNGDFAGMLNMDCFQKVVNHQAEC